MDLTSDLTVKKTKSVWQTDLTNKDSQDGIRVDDIISFLKEQKIDKFLDPDFYPSIRSLFINPKTDNKNKFRKVRIYSVFEQNPYYPSSTVFRDFILIYRYLGYVLVSLEEIPVSERSGVSSTSLTLLTCTREG